MLLNELVQTSRRVAATRSRTEKVAALADLLRRLAPDEVEVAAAFLAGQVRQGRIGLGPAAVRAALASTAPRGAAAAREPVLTLAAVDAAFGAIAAMSGAGSTGERTRRFAALLAAATSEEQELLARLIFGELRQGALAGLAVEALAAAAAVPADEVRRALMLAGELAPVARAALVDGRAGLAQLRLQLFRPLQPMLAQPAADASEALDRLGEAAFELKLDGARIQVHRDGDEVRVFSRTGNDVTAAVPEVAAAALALPARRLVLDGEAIALRPGGAPHPFQVTMRRFGRRLDVAALRQELPLTPFLFDLLHLDGDDLLDRPTQERFAALAAIAPAFVVPRLVTASAEAADAFFSQVLAQGHEGLLAKALDAPYEAGRRGAGWLKIKPAHTLDLVVLAAEWGHGRRHGWLSNLHLGARDPQNGGFVMLGKTFKGLTDEMLRWQTERFRALAIGETAGPDAVDAVDAVEAADVNAVDAADGSPGSDGSDSSDGPDGPDGSHGSATAWVVHVRPEVVVEIAFADVQESPVYPGGMALRFARVKRYRADKTAAESDTIDTVRAIFAASH